MVSSTSSAAGALPRPGGISVRGKLFAVFLASAVVMAGMLLAVLRAHREIDRINRKMVEKNVAAVKAIKAMEVSLVAGDNAMSRYLLTGDPRWLEKREEERSRFATALREVQEISETEVERTLLREIQEEIPRYDEQVRAILTARTEEDRLPPSAVSWLRRGNSVLPEIYRRCESLLAIYENQLERNRTQAEALSTRYRNLGYGTVGLVVVVTMGLSVLLRVIVLQPIRELAEGARAYAKGRLEHRVQVRGVDEFGELGRAFNEMAAALQRERGRLTEMSITDELTQLKNFRHFASRLEEEVRRAERYGHKMSLILFDIDHFKLYNDTHGHPAGNEVLRVIGRLLRDNARTTDILARYGGEEFAAILPETTKADALMLAEKIRHIVEIHSFPGEEYQPGGKLTVSCGVAAVPEDTADSPLLLDAADRALYAAKAAGRNRVIPYARGMVHPRRPERIRTPAPRRR